MKKDRFAFEVELDSVGGPVDVGVVEVQPWFAQYDVILCLHDVEGEGVAVVVDAENGTRHEASAGLSGVISEEDVDRLSGCSRSDASAPGTLC